MIKFLLLPIILVGCTGPVTDPPAHACSPRLDGKPTKCPEPDAACLSLDCPKLLPREEMRGEIDLYDPNHWQQMQFFWLRNARRNEVEKNMTQPEDAINNALLEFNNGSNDPSKSEELLQLPSNRNQEGT